MKKMKMKGKIRGNKLKRVRLIKKYLPHMGKLLSEIGDGSIGSHQPRWFEKEFVAYHS